MDIMQLSELDIVHFCVPAQTFIKLGSFAKCKVNYFVTIPFENYNNSLKMILRGSTAVLTLTLFNLFTLLPPLTLLTLRKLFKQLWSK